MHPGITSPVPQHPYHCTPDSEFSCLPASMAVSLPAASTRDTALLYTTHWTFLLARNSANTYYTTYYLCKDRQTEGKAQSSFPAHLFLHTPPFSNNSAAYIKTAILPFPSLCCLFTEGFIFYKWTHILQSVL